MKSQRYNAVVPVPVFHHWLYVKIRNAIRRRREWRDWDEWVICLVSLCLISRLVLIVIYVLLFSFSFLLFADSGGGGRPGSPIGERRSSGSGGSNSRLAEDTLAYTVQSNDTLTSLAARFDTTPSELVAINKLHSRLIFPGQVIDFFVVIPPDLAEAILPFKPSKCFSTGQWNMVGHQGQQWDGNGWINPAETLIEKSRKKGEKKEKRLHWIEWALWISFTGKRRGS